MQGWTETAATCGGDCACQAQAPAAGIAGTGCREPSLPARQSETILTTWSTQEPSRFAPTWLPVATPGLCGKQLVPKAGSRAIPSSLLQRTIPCAYMLVDAVTSAINRQSVFAVAFIGLPESSPQGFRKSRWTPAQVTTFKGFTYPPSPLFKVSRKGSAESPRHVVQHSNRRVASSGIGAGRKSRPAE